MFKQRYKYFYIYFLTYFQKKNEKRKTLALMSVITEDMTREY